jgi:hypothetical protein
MATLAGLYVYPVKSCRGIARQRAALTATGLAHDREWMVVGQDGRFLTQRDTPRLALVSPALRGEGLVLEAEGMTSLAVATRTAHEPAVEVIVWDDRCLARDEGPEAARWLTELLGRESRLVRFDPSRPRRTDPKWSQGIAGETRFSDGFPLLVLSQASLDDLNARLSAPLPLDRFRPNLLLEGCEPYAEDSLGSFNLGRAMLRAVKPCTRCVVTTTDQRTAARDGEEPLRTLKTYRWNAKLRGVTFGQNVIVESPGEVMLEIGMAVVQPAASQS